MTVAIDGPAGSGKSTIARMIAEKLGFTYINSGNVYRAITLLALRAGIGIGAQDRGRLLDLARSAPLGYSAGKLTLDGRDIETALRSPQVDALVAQVSAVPEIRTVVNALLRRIAAGTDAVVEGRDITTVVFPDAEVKFFLDASPEARARRRFDEKVSDASIDEIRKNLEMRDAIDRGKPVGPLKIADDAVYLDSSGLTTEAVYAKVYEQILHTRETHGH